MNPNKQPVCFIDVYDGKKSCVMIKKTGDTIHRHIIVCDTWSEMGKELLSQGFDGEKIKANNIKILHENSTGISWASFI